MDILVIDIGACMIISLPGQWIIMTRVCKSGYPLSGYPDLSVNFMAAKNPDILVANPDIRYPDIRIYLLILWQPKSGYLNDRL